MAGDSFFLVTMRTYRRKEWVARMMIPYIVFFATSCAAWLVSAAVKVSLLIVRLRRRRASILRPPSGRRRLTSVGGVQIDDGLAARIGATDASHENAHSLREMFEVNKMKRWTAYCSLLTALFEDIPMG
jgi:hypothetical protein